MRSEVLQPICEKSNSASHSEHSLDRGSYDVILAQNSSENVKISGLVQIRNTKQLRFDILML